MYGRVFNPLVVWFLVPFGYLPRISCEYVELDVGQMFGMKSGETLSADSAYEQDHVAEYTLRVEHVLKHVFAECRVDLRRSNGYVLLGINDDFLRVGLW